MSSKAQERAERLFQWKQDGVKAASEYEVKEQAYLLPSYGLSVWRAKQ